MTDDVVVTASFFYVQGCMKKATAELLNCGSDLIGGMIT